MRADTLAALREDAGRLEVHKIEADGALAVLNRTYSSCGVHTVRFVGDTKRAERASQANVLHGGIG
jgi:hypothetical protein